MPFFSLVLSFVLALQNARPVIVLDPGHPSEVSSGAELQNGTTEVHTAWLVALRVKNLLEQRGYRVILTKSREGQLVRNVARAEAT